MLSRLAEMQPPEMPPMYIPVTRVMESTGFMKKVNGKAMVTAITAVSPGMAPKTMPPKTPRQRYIKVRGCSVSRNPISATFMKVSIMPRGVFRVESGQTVW